MKLSMPHSPFGLFLAAVLALLSPLAGHAQGMRPATPLVAAKPAHFTLDKDEEKDFSISLSPGAYYILWDLHRPDDVASNIQATSDLLKTNGAIVQTDLLYANEIGKTARVGKKFVVAKQLAARIRVKAAHVPMEFWMTVVPLAKLAFVAFGFPNGDLKPLGIGQANGKGGTLGIRDFAYHSIKLAPGKYDVSLYLKQPDDISSNLQGSLDEMDAVGVPVEPRWELTVNQIGKDGRVEKRLLLLKPQTLILRVTNENNSRQTEYTVDIEKATD